MTDQVECNCAWNPDRHAETCPVYMQQRIEALRAEIEELDTLRNRQSDLLSQTAIALRGPEPALTRYSHADIPSRVKTVIEDLEAARGLLERMQLASSVYRSTLRSVRKDIRDDIARGGMAESWNDVAATISIVLEQGGETKAAELQRCQTCDGTGDVHRTDGEYLGECDCSKAHKAAIEAGDLMAIAEECGAGRMAENVAQVTRCDLERIIQFVRNQKAEREGGDR